MKKLLVLGAFALFGAMNAQTEKGSWVIGGTTNLGFNNRTDKGEYDGESGDGKFKTSTFGFSPSVAYFVANKIAVGLDASFISTTQKYDGVGSDDKFTTSTFAIMPTGTYYFKSDSKVLPYLGVGLGFASQKEGDDDSDKFSGFAWKGKGGVVFLLNQTVGIDLGLSYMGGSLKNGEDSKLVLKSNQIGVNAGISIFLK